MTAEPFEPLVSVEWLSDRLGQSNLSTIDASWYAEGRDPYREYMERHIPGAVFFNIDKIADASSELSRTLPSPEQFEAQVGELGISNASHVVVYDTSGLLSAARAWWMFRVFGHDKVSILDGGLPSWLASGHPTESGAVAVSRTVFKASFRSDLYCSFEDAQVASETGSAIILDGRGAGRFAGEEPETQAPRAGHIPGSLNLHAAQLFDAKAQKVRSKDEIQSLLKSVEILPDAPIITTCGSGVAACTLAFGLFLAGQKNAAVYDGSWEEWGRDASVPVETGRTS